ncbi:MAG: hypothetical protein GWN00_11635, partial [Aliifodinibius sp.]|nr:glycosyltransferase family 39 protein [candidate division Zixibacteria bacterium]NIT56849.1 glycosyltransferase family 39 protein [Fodinibius sp.]NIW47195.1 hypothetical protein [Gammaproteobacteria bacterium]NIS45828.1 glycosyltransferase family 39 protein [candidate division Zixibacteria bacterium]NIU15755.1 glycosyltransferase family 39 protein [candidate division Zixibacteria bacterium]
MDKNELKKFLSDWQSKIVKIPVWLSVSIIALISRIPLIMLPGAGRDEATYFYWAMHPEPAYSPLLQLALKGFSILPLSQMLILRLPSIAAGILVLYLFDRLLQARGLSHRSRGFALTILAFTPWQAYTGVILHPDNFLLTMILSFLLFTINRQYWAAALIAGLAPWTKLSGILILPVLFYFFIKYQDIHRRKLMYYGLTSFILALPVLFSLNMDLLKAISEFGQMAESVSFWEAASIQLGTTLLLGGIFLPIAGVKGFMDRLRLLLSGKLTEPDHLNSLNIALILLGAFGIAALVFNQLKGNWILPALAVLWPRFPLKLSTGLHRTVLTVSVLSGLTLVISLSQPAIIGLAEKAFPEFRSSYSLQAGTRESRVSATRSWTQRVNEYQSIDQFADSVLRQWQTLVNQQGKPTWIVSDDYGLTAQLIFAWDDSDTRMIIPGDGIFNNSLPGDDAQSIDGNILILAV